MIKLFTDTDSNNVDVTFAEHSKKMTYLSLSFVEQSKQFNHCGDGFLICHTSGKVPVTPPLCFGLE